MREREMIKKKVTLTRIAPRSLLVEAEEGGWRSGGIRCGPRAGTVRFDFFPVFLCGISVTNFVWARR